MSRLTGTDAYGLMEAYNAVYAPQELTEEQVWEEVETWVNDLIEEGYDLSEYTWDDMYESYIEEQGNRRGGNRDRGTGIQLSLPGGSAGSGLGRQGAKRALEKPRVSSLPASARQVTQYPAGVPTGVGGGNAGASIPAATAPARPAAQAPARPAAQAPARPAAPAPSARPAAPAPSARPAAPAAGTQKPAPASTPAAPAKPSLSSQADEIRKMRASSLQRQGKPLDAATVSASTKPAFQANSFDPFDVVIGHLLDEGYADTEEAALVIMANMSEEWRESIVEGGTGAFVPSRVDDFNNRRDMLKNRYGQDVGPRIPGPSGGGQYGEPPAPKAMGVRLARGTSSPKRGVESKNNA